MTTLDRSTKTFTRAALAAAVLAGGLGAAHAVPIPGQGTWETTLQARDINGDSVVDAYYDTALDITWLANPKAAAGTAFDDGISNTDGRMTYAGASTWLASLDVHGVTGWRFAHEISSMYYTTLGNTNTPGFSGWNNTGPFANVGDFPASSSGWYWTGETPHDNPWCPPSLCPMQTTVFWADSVGAGYYTDVDVDSSKSVWAVHDGDVPVRAVPEPQTWALLVLGLGLVCWRRYAGAPGNR